jgi:hypothetical protein
MRWLTEQWKLWIETHTYIDSKKYHTYQKIIPYIQDLKKKKNPNSKAKPKTLQLNIICFGYIKV